MEKELMETVAKHLPAMQMQVLRDELAKVERIPKLESEILILKDDLYREKEKTSKFLKEISDLTARAKTTEELAKEKLDLDRKILEIRYECANSRIYDLKELIGAAFRNPEIQKTYNKEVPLMNPGGWIMRESEVHTETTVRK